MREKPEIFATLQPRSLATPKNASSRHLAIRNRRCLQILNTIYSRKKSWKNYKTSFQKFQESKNEEHERDLKPLESLKSQDPSASKKPHPFSSLLPPSPKKNRP